MSNFEEAIQKINKFVTFQEHDRKNYMDDFDAITKYIIYKLKQSDEVFNKLCKGNFFQGSYADNLKVSKPDEYDIVIHLKLPKMTYANITADPSKPGYVNINILQVLEKLPQDQPIWKKIQKRLEYSVDSNGFLDQKKISSWFESMMTKILNDSETISFFTNKSYTKCYFKSGPAHTLHVNSADGKEISIDYVPGFLFDNSKWVASRHWKYDGYHRTSWLAIPKPKKDAHTDKNPNISFIASYCDTERDIIKGKHQLKNAIRLIKKLRDKQGIERLKSYHIKTVFLWKDEREDISFWNNSASYVFVTMLRELIECVKEENLPFFWDPKQNMFVDLKKNQLETMGGQLQAVYNRIVKRKMEKPISPNLYKEFLTDDEIFAMNNGKTLEQKLEEDRHGILRTAFNTTGAGLLVAGLSYCVFKAFNAIKQNNTNNK